MHEPGTAPHGVLPEGAADLDHAQLLELVAHLERQVETLREGIRTRERIGVAVGLLAQRYGSSPEDAWALLSSTSQALNVKVRRVADVVHDVWSGRLREEDAELAGRLSRVLPAVAPGQGRT